MPQHARRSPGRKFAVLGSGICGMVTGNLLLDTYPDAEVTIYTDGAKNIVTLAAGAQFYPIWLGDNLPEGYDVLLRKWFLASKKRFMEHSKLGMAIRHAQNYELFTEPTEPPAYFYDVLSNLRVEASLTLPSPYTHYYIFDTMIIDPIRYLSQITERFVSRGGTIVQKRIRHVDDVLRLSEDTVFNCLGLASRDIFGDSSMYPVKGISFRLQPIPELRHAVSAGDIIIAPRVHETYMGAPYSPTWDSEQPTAKEEAYVFDNVRSIMETPGNPFSLPKGTIRREDIIEVRAGFRPVRSQGPRVEREDIDGKTVIHNYGHGGNGVTLSWGTAEHALGLIDLTS